MGSIFRWVSGSVNVELALHQPGSLAGRPASIMVIAMLSAITANLFAASDAKTKAQKSGRMATKKRVSLLADYSLWPANEQVARSERSCSPLPSVLCGARAECRTCFQRTRWEFPDGARAVIRPEVH